MTGQDHPPGPIRVLIAEDHEIARHGIIADLASAGGFEVVGETPDGGEAVALAFVLKPDVVVMDLTLKTVNGIEATRRIREGVPEVRVLVLSASHDRNDVLDSIEAGANGYVLKEDRAATVVEAARVLGTGGSYLSPSVSQQVIEGLPVEPRLTPRENEVLELLAKGLTYGQIGSRMFIAEKTVHSNVDNMRAKLQLHTKYELMRHAWERGFGRSPD